MLWYKDPWKNRSWKERFDYLWNHCSVDKSVKARIKGALSFLFFCRICGYYTTDLPISFRWPPAEEWAAFFKSIFTELNPKRAYKRWKRRRRKALQKKMREAQP